MIRKLSIGMDYKTAMHYIVGQSIFGGYVIHLIKIEEDGFDIYIKKDGEIMKWKHISKSTPTVIEYDLNY